MYMLFASIIFEIFVELTHVDKIVSVPNISINHSKKIHNIPIMWGLVQVPQTRADSISVADSTASSGMSDVPGSSTSDLPEAFELHKTEFVKASQVRLKAELEDRNCMLQSTGALDTHCHLL